MTMQLVEKTRLSCLQNSYGVLPKVPVSPQSPPLRRKYSDQESFQPEYHQIKRMGLKVNKKKIFTGAWSSHQNLVYLKFMLQNSQDFLNQANRRKSKVFFRLSKILKKRTPDQCRSHHQKLQLKFKDDLALIVKDVHTKIQKAMTEDYVNEQFRLQRAEIDRMIEMAGLASRPPAMEVLQKENWYQISRRGNSFRLTIDESAIKSW